MNEGTPQISVIIPVYNEEDGIADVVRGFFTLGLPDIEVLVIDDGSSDNTAKVAAEAGAVVLKHPYNIGNGAAVKTGIRAAKGKVLVFIDGDGQHDPKDLPRMLPNIVSYHMVVGSRTKGSQTTWHRDLANALFNWLASCITRFQIKDLTSGFRILRSSDAQRFCDMFPNGFSYPSTSTLAFLRTGRSVAYIPIQTKFRAGKSKINLVKDGIGFLIIIMKITMTFSPLRVFIPVSLAFLALGLIRYAYTYLLYGQFTNMAGLLINSAGLIFLLGLIAEQIVSLRLERSGNLFDPEDQRTYEVFKKL